MNHFLENFKTALNAHDKDACVRLIHEGLDANSFTLIEAYEDILSKAMADVSSSQLDPRHKIWDEHVKTQIVRTVLESLYPIVMRTPEILPTRRVALVCPEGEYHELGLRIIADVFRLSGYRPYFFGNSLPKFEIKDLITSMDFAYVVLSASNFYVLPALNASIATINELRPDLKILVGGHAVTHNHDAIHGNNVTIVTTLEELKTLLTEEAR